MTDKNITLDDKDMVMEPIVDEELEVETENEEVETENEEADEETEEEPKTELYAVLVTVPSLNIRKGPGKNFDAVATTKADTKLMVIKVATDDAGKKWGKLKTGGWVALEFVKKTRK